MGRRFRRGERAPERGTITDDLGNHFYLVVIDGDEHGMQKVLSLAGSAADLLLFDTEAAAKAWLAGPGERVIRLVKKPDPPT